MTKLGRCAETIDARSPIKSDNVGRMGILPDVLRRFDWVTRVIRFDPVSYRARDELGFIVCVCISVLQFRRRSAA